MNRPGPVGLAILTAFAVVAVIELRTVLGAIGIDVAIGPYYAGVTILFGVSILAVYALPKNGTPARA